MKAWEDWALISEDKVKDVCCFKVGSYTEAQRVAQAIYGAEAFAVDVSYIPVQTDDTYQNGQFLRDGKVIKAYRTEEQEIAAHDRVLDELTIAILEG